MDERKNSRCEQVRELLTELVDPNATTGSEQLIVEGETVHQHVENCSSCRTWRSQMTDMVMIAQSLPQFDVSESLTQSIMRGVEQVDKTKQYRLTWVVYAAAVALFLYATLYVDAYESIWGIGSWVVGLGTMIVLKMLIAEPKHERQVV